MTFVLRHSIDEAELMAAARQAMADADPSRPLVNPGVVERSLTARLPELRNYVSAVGAFGIAALLLAAMGVYGVTAFAVAARMREMGIRRALGAGSLEVISAIGRRAAVLIVVGVIAGVSCAAGLTRFIASQLWGVAPTDPVTFAAAAATLALVAAAACIGPTRRALAVDPASVLRSE
jgi:ABC-type antimicrobial peptide transport system permease subunit